MNRTPSIVLVVEDDWLLRLVAVEILEEAGFVALDAANADEAIVMLERREDIAAIITDVDMPGTMNGLKLAHAVRRRWPPIKIIVVSGKAHVSDAELPSDARFLSKPYSVSVMIGELRSLLAPSSLRHCFRVIHRRLKMVRHSHLFRTRGDFVDLQTSPRSFPKRELDRTVQR